MEESSALIDGPSNCGTGGGTTLHSSPSCNRLWSLSILSVLRTGVIPVQVVCCGDSTKSHACAGPACVSGNLEACATVCKHCQAVALFSSQRGMMSFRNLSDQRHHCRHPYPAARYLRYLGTFRSPICCLGLVLHCPRRRRTASTQPSQHLAFAFAFAFAFHTLILVKGLCSSSSPFPCPDRRTF